MADKEGYGFLYPNKKRERNQPNVSGNVIVNGQKVTLSGWTKAAKDGTRYINLKAEVAAEEGLPPDPANEDIPF